MENLSRSKYYNKSGVYRIYSVSNGKSYVGSSSNLYKRVNMHINDLKNNKKTNIKLQYHYNKYGEKDLVIEIVCYCSVEDLFKTELRFIKEYDCVDNGFNCLEFPGSARGYKFTQEQLTNLKLITKENVIKHRQSLLERLEKARLSLILNPIKIDWWIGRKHTQESKIKMSNSAKRRGPLNEREVIQLDLNNNIMKKYKSAKEAERMTGIPAANIGKCCLNKRKTAGKSKWNFNQTEE